MELGLQGKIALVTGASGGIGSAIAIGLAREGCDVALTGRDAARLEEAAAVIKALGRRALVHTADLCQADAAAGFIAAGLKAFGRIDIVAHSAGATKRGDFLQLTDQDFVAGFALKFMAAVRITRAAWPHLVQSKGTIVNIIGAGGRYPKPDFTIGGSVNAALMNFTKAMAKRGVKEGVRVTGINPGDIETDRLKVRVANLMRDRNVDEQAARDLILLDRGIFRFGRPDEVAQLVCYLASSPAGFLQGTVVEMTGGAGNAL